MALIRMVMIHLDEKVSSVPLQEKHHLQDREGSHCMFKHHHHVTICGTENVPRTMIPLNLHSHLIWTLCSWAPCRWTLVRYINKQFLGIKVILEAALAWPFWWFFWSEIDMVVWKEQRRMKTWRMFAASQTGKAAIPPRTQHGRILNKQIEV